MLITKKNIILFMVIAIGSLRISAMEPEQKENQLRLQRQNQEQKKLNKRTLINLVAQLEELQTLQNKIQQSTITTQEHQKLQKLQQRFEKLTPQQYQEVDQQLKRQQAQWDNLTSQKQPLHSKKPQSQSLNISNNNNNNYNPHDNIIPKEIAMKQILLDERDTYITFLEDKLADRSYKPQTIRKAATESQTSIDRDLLEPSQQLKNEAIQIKKLPTIKQQAKQNDKQQEQLARIIKQSQLIQSKDSTCCICFENKDLGIIPCENYHTDVCICTPCLDQIKESTNKCPICRQPLKQIKK